MKDQAGDATRIDKKIVAPDLKPLSPSESEARAFFQRLIFSIRNFEAALGADHELYVTMPSAPGVRIYDINKNSEAFYFSGEDIEGRSAMAIQHYTQVTVTLVAIPLSKGEAPRRIGFLEESS